MCDCARANDVTEIINYKLHFLNRKLITEGILHYFCDKSTFEDKLNSDAGINFILLIFACVVLRKVHVQCAFTVYVGYSGFPECLLFLVSDKR